MNTHTFPSPARRQAGFSIIEMTVAVAIVAALALAALPAMAGYLQASRVRSTTSDLFSTLLFARGEAARTNVRVVVCNSADGSRCAAAGGWEQGWIVFHDTNGNGVPDAGEPIVQHGHPAATGLRASGNSTVSRYVSYTPEGLAKLVGGGFQAGTITVCPASLEPADARQIIVNSGGRPRVQQAHAADCA
ncbi:MAG TPA: GspH/FimT family protein [Ramlibacter sp.]